VLVTVGQQREPEVVLGSAVIVTRHLGTAMVSVAARGVVPRRWRRDRRGRQRHRADGPDEGQAAVPGARTHHPERERPGQEQGGDLEGDAGPVHDRHRLGVPGMGTERQPGGAADRPHGDQRRARHDHREQHPARRPHQHGDGEEDLHPRRDDEAGALDGGLPEMRRRHRRMDQRRPLQQGRQQPPLGARRRLCLRRRCRFLDRQRRHRSCRRRLRRDPVVEHVGHGSVPPVGEPTTRLNVE
jgi:hypothetical protein